MGTTKVESSGTSTAKPTEQEEALNKLQLEQAQAAQEGTIAAQGAGLNLVNKLLTGSTDLPGYLKQLAGGITEEQTQGMVQSSLADIYPQFQSSGILDSGTAAAVAGGVAGDIRNQNAQFNIGALQNMLNLALSGQAQVQGTTQGVTSQLGSRLAGLRTTTTSGTQSSNPFMTSLYSSLGSNMGSWVSPKTWGFGG